MKFRSQLIVYSNRDPPGERKDPVAQPRDPLPPRKGKAAIDSGELSHVFVFEEQSCRASHCGMIFCGFLQGLMFLPPDTHSIRSANLGEISLR